MSSQPKILYDNYAAHYSRLNQADCQPDVSRQMQANVGRFLPASKEASILDYGCGQGHVLTFLKQQGYENAVGIDISLSQVQIAHNRGVENSYVVDNPIEWLRRNAETFHFVGSFDVIEHIPKPEVITTLTAIRDALKPGGTFVCRVPNITSFTGPVTRHTDFTHEWSYTEESITQVLELAGFTAIEALPEITAYRRKVLGFGFEMVRSVLYGVMKTVHRIQSPGSRIPRIFTGNLYAVSKRPV
jgi:2-polyprenyl-3-methyl-5-hydroxy-6-metoxy-1,4-benzoquinol methylase